MQSLRLSILMQLLVCTVCPVAVGTPWAVSSSSYLLAGIRVVHDGSYCGQVMMYHGQSGQRANSTEGCRSRIGVKLSTEMLSWHALSGGLQQDAAFVTQISTCMMNDLTLNVVAKQARLAVRPKQIWLSQSGQLLGSKRPTCSFKP
jgi:hypothetical protein